MGKRSFSQLETYARCPEQYRLQRLVGIPEHPSIWLSAGTAMHSACDAIDLHHSTPEEAQGVFVDVFQTELNVELSKEGAPPLEEFRTTGVTKERPNGRDYGWWINNSLPMLARYAEWRETSDRKSVV